jgi:hypothetical protein
LPDALFSFVLPLHSGTAIGSADARREERDEPCPKFDHMIRERMIVRAWYKRQTRITGIALRVSMRRLAQKGA